MTNQNTSPEEPLEKSDSASYPYMALPSSLELAEAVKDLGGARTNVQRSILAHHLKIEEKSQTLTFKIASARCYGLIEGRSSFLLTEKAKHYFFPTNEKEKTQALLDFFCSPVAFSGLAKRFDGNKLPTSQMIGNILHRDLHVPDSWKDRVATYFVRSAQHIGILDDQGYLRCAAAEHSEISDPNKKIGGIDPDVERGNLEKDEKFPAKMVRYRRESNPNIWSFCYKEQSVKVETPVDLPKPLWESLNAYVQLLKTTIKDDDST